MYKGIDLDHIRFLILQGEVEQMALMKPKGLTENDGGMLELLEDIIGTSRFKTLFVQLYYCVEELSNLRTEKLKPVKGSCKKTTFLEFFLKLGEGSPNTQNLLLVNYSPKTPLKHLTITQDFSTCQISKGRGWSADLGKFPKIVSLFYKPLKLVEIEKDELEGPM